MNIIKLQRSNQYAMLSVTDTDSVPNLHYSLCSCTVYPPRFLGQITQENRDLDRDWNAISCDYEAFPVVVKSLMNGKSVVFDIVRQELVPGDLLSEMLRVRESLRTHNSFTERVPNLRVANT